MTGERGLEPNIFWRSPRGTELLLNPNFSLVTLETVVGHYTQAEVLFAVSATLHNIRFGSAYEPNLFRAVCQRIVLSPRNFDRFNDGIVQAAMLRLAHPIEIDYRFSKEISDEICDLISDSANRLSEQASDSLPEFLLALAMQRLQLHTESIPPLIEKLEVSLAGNPFLADLLKILRSEIVSPVPTQAF